MSLQPSPKRTPESCSVLVNAALVAYLPKPKTDKRKNLWSKNEEESVQEATEVLSFACATALKPSPSPEDK